ncbi:hypothetical protein L9F63_016606, partial [Diploptera punctata]
MLNGYEARRLFHKGRGHGGMLGVPNHMLDLSLPPDEWFDQQLDHFNPTDMRTWKQRYFTNASFHVPGGPVFLMIGGEGTASPKWMVQGQWINYAQKYKALCFQLEHRFYGKSHPTSDLSTKNLVYLSSEQALADLAYFIRGMTEKYRLPADTKWIAFGGSYPGSLAAWLRAKYPYLVHGSMSASGPLLAIADFKEYFEVVRDDLLLYKTSCIDAVKEANKQIHLLLKHPIGQRTINKLFYLCDPIDVKNKNDVSNLYESLAGNLAGVAQYNKDNREGTHNITLDTVCDVMSNQSIGTPVHRFAAVNNILLQASDEKCLDYKYDKMIKELQNTDWTPEEGARAWTYQTCTEFGFYQTSALTTDMFGNEFPVNFFIQQCSDIFGSSSSNQHQMQGIERTNTLYGALQQYATRIVYVHGSVDPWHALGITKTLISQSPAIYINGTAHCANMYPSSPNDLPQLVEAREKISNLIGVWLTEKELTKITKNVE